MVDQKRDIDDQQRNRRDLPPRRPIAAQNSLTRRSGSFSRPVRARNASRSSSVSASPSIAISRTRQPRQDAPPNSRRTDQGPTRPRALTGTASWHGGLPMARHDQIEARRFRLRSRAKIRLPTRSRTGFIQASMTNGRPCRGSPPPPLSRFSARICPFRRGTGGGWPFPRHKKAATRRSAFI